MAVILGAFEAGAIVDGSLGRGFLSLVITAAASGWRLASKSEPNHTKPSPPCRRGTGKSGNTGCVQEERMYKCQWNTPGDSTPRSALLYIHTDMDMCNVNNISHSYLGGEPVHNLGALTANFCCSLAWCHGRISAGKCHVHTSETHVDSIHVLVRDHPMFSLHVLAMNCEREVLGHDAINIDDLNAGRLEGLAEMLEWLVAVELGTVEETACPCEYRSNGVRRRLVAFLVLTVVAGDGAVCSLTFDNLAVGRNELAGHHAQGAEALCKDIGLNVTIVILTRPDKSSRGFDGLSNHVVDKAVFIVDAELLKCSLVLGVIDFLEDVLEATIVPLHDGVLGGHKLWDGLGTTNVCHGDDNDVREASSSTRPS